MGTGLEACKTSGRVLGFTVTGYGLRFRVQGARFGVRSGLKVSGLRFWGLGFEFQI
jgi:hypothetical protein